MFVWAGDECCPTLISILRYPEIRCVCYREGKIGVCLCCEFVPCCAHFAGGGQWVLNSVNFVSHLTDKPGF